MIRARASAGLLLTVATLIGAGGCYQGPGKTVVDQPPSGNGTDFTVGDDLIVQDLTIISDGAGSGTTVMTVLNNGDADDALVGLTTEPASTASATTRPPSAAAPSATPTSATPTPAPEATDPGSVATTPEPVTTTLPATSAPAAATSPPAAPAGSLLALPAGQAVQVGGPAATSITLTGLTTTPGHYLNVTLSFARSGSATQQVIVVPNAGYYASYGPGGATAAPAPSTEAEPPSAAAEH